MFAPVIADGVRAVFNKFTGGDGAKRANAEEAIDLIDAGIRKMKAIAELDAVGSNVSQWVNNARALMRPLSVVVILISWITVLVMYGGINPQEVINIVSNLASSAVFYLFGDRTYMYFRKDKK